MKSPFTTTAAIAGIFALTVTAAFAQAPVINSEGPGGNVPYRIAAPTADGPGGEGYPHSDGPGGSVPYRIAVPANGPGGNVPYRIAVPTNGPGGEGYPHSDGPGHTDPY